MQFVDPRTPPIRSHKKKTMRTATALLSCLLPFTACLAEETAQSLVEKAAARYGAMKSGRLAYLWEPPFRLDFRHSQDWSATDLRSLCRSERP